MWRRTVIRVRTAAQDHPRCFPLASSFCVLMERWQVEAHFELKETAPTLPSISSAPAAAERQALFWKGKLFLKTAGFF